MDWLRWFCFLANWSARFKIAPIRQRRFRLWKIAFCCECGSATHPGWEIALLLSWHEGGHASDSKHAASRASISYPTRISRRPCGNKTSIVPQAARKWFSTLVLVNKKTLLHMRSLMNVLFHVDCRNKHVHSRTPGCLSGMSMRVLDQQL